MEEQGFTAAYTELRELANAGPDDKSSSFGQSQVCVSFRLVLVGGAEKRM